MRRILLPLAAVVLSACGATVTKTVTSTVAAVPASTNPAPIANSQKPSIAQLARTCPPGKSSMGCSTPRLLRAPHAFLAPPSGPLFPDVYEGQGTVDWNAVKRWQASHGWHPAAIFKMGEFRLDHQAARNAQQLAALGFWRSGYWFVRATGCLSEANQITDAAHQLGIVVVSLDLEVPEAAGYGACLSPTLRLRGFVVDEYTSPGSNPGGVDTSDPLWIATFGSGFSCIWTCSPVAWQFTDGTFGAVTFIPGIGRDDVNVDLGITKLGAPPPDPYALYPQTIWTLKFGVKASEYGTVKTWDQKHCLVPVLRPVCKSSFFHLELLRDRIYWVAHHALVHGHWVTVHHPRWSEPKGHPLGSRYAGVTHRLAQRK